MLNGRVKLKLSTQQLKKLVPFLKDKRTHKRSKDSLKNAPDLRKRSLLKLLKSTLRPPKLMRVRRLTRRKKAKKKALPKDKVMMMNQKRTPRLKSTLPPSKKRPTRPRKQP